MDTSVVGFRLGWRLVRVMPERLAYLVFSVMAQFAWLRQGRGVRQLEANLARVVPEASPFRLKSLSRKGMHSYLRYWCDVFRSPDWDDERILRSCRAVDDSPVRAALAEGRGVVLALAHQGNWDHAGAWAARELAPVTTVAERVRPEEVYQRFVAYRRVLGIEVHPLNGGPDPFPAMVRAAREGHVVPLLADRDLRATGVAVTMFGESVKVAAGPAAVALVTGAPLFPVSIHYERLPSSAPSRWGIVIRFHPEIRPERGLSRAEQLVSMMQRCTNALALGIRHHPEDWHMLQSIFDGDLTPQIPAARAAETAALRASEKREARPGQERRGRKPEEFPAGGNS